MKKFHSCLTNKEDGIIVSKKLDNVNGVDHKKRRIVEMRIYLRERNDANTKTEKKKICYEYGLSPYVSKNGMYEKNPF